MAQPTYVQGVEAEADGAADDDEVEEALEDAIDAAEEDAEGAQLEDALEDALEDVLEDVLDDSLEDALDGALEEALDETLDEALEESLEDELEELLDDGGAELADAVGEALVSDEVLLCEGTETDELSPGLIDALDAVLLVSMPRSATGETLTRMSWKPQHCWKHRPAMMRRSA